MGSEQASKSELTTTPMIVYVKIGPFRLYGIPLYPPKLIRKAEPFRVDILGTTICLE